MRSVSLFARRGIASKKAISVIVADTIPGVGSKGEIKAVRPGYARNQLFPKKMAVYDTPVNRIKFDDFTKNLRLEDRAEEEKRKKAIARIETVVVKLKRQVMDKDPIKGDRLHAPIFAKDVVKALWRQHYIAVLEENLKMSKTGIRAIGKHTVPVYVGDATKHVVATLHVLLEARNKEKEKPTVVA